MLVAFNVKGDTAHHAIDVDTTNFREAIATVKNHYAEGLKTLDRCFAVIECGKKPAPAPVFDFTPISA